MDMPCLYRINVKKAAKEKERQGALDNQKQIDGEVAEYYASQRARELEEHAARLEHRRLLDKVLADKKRDEERKKEMDLAEEKEIEVFAAAKRVSYLTMAPAQYTTLLWMAENDKAS